MLYQEYFDENDDYRKLEIRYAKIKSLIHWYMFGAVSLIIVIISLGILSTYHGVKLIMKAFPKTNETSTNNMSTFEFITIIKMFFETYLWLILTAFMINHVQHTGYYIALVKRQKEIKNEFTQLTLQISNQYR